jgi:putative ABC transport system permease protein
VRELVDDLRSGIRALARRPGFLVAATVLLGLGVGATTSVFSLIDSCLLRPLPYADASRVVSITEERPGSRSRTRLHPLHLFLVQAEARSFDSIASYVTADNVGFDLSWGDQPERVAGAAVSAGFFRILGVEPALGRGFTKQEDAAGAPVVILSHRLWKGRYGEDPALVGRPIKVSGVDRIVVGVMPPGFDFPGVEIWLPDPLHVDEAMGLPVLTTYSHAVLARLKEGTTLEQARGEMKRLTRSLWEAEPWIASKRLAFTLTPLREELLGDLRLILWVLFGSTGLLLLITCTNLSNLFLGRLITRQAELALRSVLGATDRRLARQLLVEAMFVGVAGGLAGLLLSALTLKGVLPLLAPILPPWLVVRMDLRVLGFVVFVAGLTGILTGLVPVLRRARFASRDRLAEVSSSSPRGRRLWGLLVVAQIALSFVLLIGVGLMFRSSRKLAERPLGFDPAHILTFEVAMNKRLYPSGADRLRFAHRIQERLSRMPGVVSAAVSVGLPIEDSGYSVFLVTREDQEQADLTTLPMADCWMVSPSFFRTTGIRLERGQGFTANDHAQAPPVVIVDEAVEARLWPGESALGKRLQTGGVWREVVGVAAPVATGRPRQEPADLIFAPLDQTVYPASSFTILLKTAGKPQSLIPAVRVAIRDVSPRQTVYGLTTMDARLTQASARERLVSLVLGLFALFGLILALSGLFAVVRFAAVVRHKELGIRIALGAGRSEILKLALWQGGRLIVAGVAAGLAIALPSAQLLSRLLYGVSPSDPLTYLAVAALLVAAALPAVVLPGIEALRSGPVRLLRSD